MTSKPFYILLMLAFKDAIFYPFADNNECVKAGRAVFTRDITS